MSAVEIQCRGSWVSLLLAVYVGDRTHPSHGECGKATVAEAVTTLWSVLRQAGHYTLSSIFSHPSRHYSCIYHSLC